MVTYMLDNPIVEEVDEWDIVSPDESGPGICLEIIGKSDELDVTFERAEDGWFDIFVTAPSFDAETLKEVLSTVLECTPEDIVLKIPHLNGFTVV